ncbi:MAG TPA: hypothetical protein VL981_13690 [Candidatus Methylacidiphilales bacterium]|nr:hypothetical protein [Candidatus Methylacidiphilales bacterium]
MSTNQDNKWEELLALSASTFAGESAPPYGFMTRTLAQLRQEQQEDRQVGWLCWRAIFASLGALVVAASVTISVHNYSNRGDDMEPGIGRFIQVENIQVS